MASTQGDAEVTVMLGDGHRAKVSVKLISANQNQVAYVYGTITAGPIAKVFEKKREEAIAVDKGSFIPVNDVINLPSNSTSFEITVNLMNKDGTDFHSDHEIANGSPNFEVKPANDTETKSVGGHSGSVEVIVVWG